MHRQPEENFVIQPCSKRKCLGCVCGQRKKGEGGTLRAACMMSCTMGAMPSLPMAVAISPMASVARHRRFTYAASVACKAQFAVADCAQSTEAHAVWQSAQLCTLSARLAAKPHSSTSLEQTCCDTPSRTAACAQEESKAASNFMVCAMLSRHVHSAHLRNVLSNADNVARSPTPKALPDCTTQWTLDVLPKPQSIPLSTIHLGSQDWEALPPCTGAGQGKLQRHRAGRKRQQHWLQMQWHPRRFPGFHCCLF